MLQAADDAQEVGFEEVKALGTPALKRTTIALNLDTAGCLEKKDWQDVIYKHLVLSMDTRSLRAKLDELGVSTTGCVEKSDYQQALLKRVTQGL